MKQADRIAETLGGHRTATGFLCRCPVAGHGRGRGDLNPSLSISDGEQRLLLRCFAGCDVRDVLDALRRDGLLEGASNDTPPTPNRQLAGASVTRHLAVDTEPDPKAIRLWRSARRVRGTPAEVYLLNRGITQFPPASLRFTPSLWHPRERERFPAMVAGVSGPDRRVTACQATFLTPDGMKAAVDPVRRTYGSLGRSALRLAPVDKVLGLAEGLESAMAAHQITGVPAWAVLGSQRLDRIEVPETVEEVVIFSDNDGPGLKAACAAMATYESLGYRVTVRQPEMGHGDWADELIASVPKMETAG